ncbi:MAG: quinone oxidoreductase family protein [Limnobacter sp.]|uniref:quinone oxidoreductase family protein n=1 Tax=Limnobacter sp. TaxID=2003368 RepID=UPI00391910D0
MNTTTQTIRIHAHGGPEVLKLDTLDLPAPGPGEVQIEHKAIGLNFIEVYWRTGLYPLPLPSGLGNEASGVVLAVGEGVDGVKPGDRVAYASGPVGAYSTRRNLPAGVLVKLPDHIGFDTAAAIMLKGLTAQYLLRRVYRVQAGDTVLFHAAAGGVGLIACQWAKALGAKVIGTVSTPDKAALALANGCETVLIAGQDDIVARVRSLTDGQGVPVVYDGVGKDTFVQSLDCLRPCGLMVSFGNASGAVDPVPLAWLAQRGSLMLTRPTLATFTAQRDMLQASADELFAAVGSGQVQVHINQRYALADAALAHAALESRQTTGSTVLVP